MDSFPPHWRAVSIPVERYDVFLSSVCGTLASNGTNPSRLMRPRQLSSSSWSVDG